MKQAGDLDQRLAKGQTAIEKLRELVPFYEKGLVKLNPSPQEWVAHIYGAIRDMTNKHISTLLETAIREAQRVRSPVEKSKRLTSVLDSIIQYEVHLGKTNVARWRRRVESEMGYLIAESDRAAERDAKRTIGQYVEMLDILQAEDQGDPEVLVQIEKYKKLITDLGGELPPAKDPADSKPPIPGSSSGNRSLQRPAGNISVDEPGA